MKDLYEASLKERLEMYIDNISLEIIENEKMIHNYEANENHKAEILKFFRERLNIIKSEFETAIKVIKGL